MPADHENEHVHEDHPVRERSLAEHCAWRIIPAWRARGGLAFSLARGGCGSSPLCPVLACTCRPLVIVMVRWVAMLTASMALRDSPCKTVPIRKRSTARAWISAAVVHRRPWPPGLLPSPWPLPPTVRFGTSSIVGPARYTGGTLNRSQTVLPQSAARKTGVNQTTESY